MVFLRVIYDLHFLLRCCYQTDRSRHRYLKCIFISILYIGTFQILYVGIPNYICLRRSDQPVCVSSVVNIPDANTSLLTWTLFPKCSGSVNGRLSSVTDSSKCLWPKNIIILLVYLAQKFWPNLLYRETLVLEFFHHHRQRLRYMWNSLSILLSRPFYCGNILYRRWLYFLHSFYVMCQ